MLSFTLSADDIAAQYLHQATKTFYNARPKLYAAGFPRPLDLGCPSEPLWLRQDVENWLANRPRRNDHLAAPPPPPTQDQPIKRGRGRPRKNGGAA